MATPDHDPAAKPSPWKDLPIITGLAFVAGFVDTAAFISLAGLFTAHVTGNFVIIGAELVSSSTGVLAKLLALPVFVLAVALTRLAALTLERHRLATLRWLLAGEAMLLAAFGIAGVVLSPLGSPDSAAAVATGMLGVAAMGTQNAIGRLALSHLVATTVMTINVTQGVIDAVDALRGVGETGVSTRLRRMLISVLAFAIGALAGAFGVVSLSFWCLAVPVLVLSVLIASRTSAAGLAS